MPYYLSDFVEVPRRRKRARPLLRPRGFDAGLQNFIVIGKRPNYRAISYFPNPISDPRLVLLADTKEERVSAAARGALAGVITDRGLGALPFNEIIADVFRTPPVDWNVAPMGRVHSRQREELFLGPDETFWTKPLPGFDKHSKYFWENGTGASGAIAGTPLTSSGCDWAEIDPSFQWIRSGGLLTFVFVDGEAAEAYTTTGVDTDVAFVQAILGTLTIGLGDAIGWGIRQGFDDSADAGYQLNIENVPGVGDRSLEAVFQGIGLASDSTLSTAGTFTVLRESTTVTVLENGAPILGTPVSNSGEPTGATARQTYMYTYVDGDVSTSLIQVLTFISADYGIGLNLLLSNVRNRLVF